MDGFSTLSSVVNYGGIFRWRVGKRDRVGLKSFISEGEIKLGAISILQR